MTQGEQFEAEFWKRYPRKEKKIAARDAWRWAMQNHNQDGQLVEKIVAALIWQTEVHSEWKYWTSPDRWLLGQRWTDEQPPPVVIRPTAQELADYQHVVRSVASAGITVDMQGWLRRRRA